MDPFYLSGHYNFNEMDTAFDSLPTHRPPNRVSMSVPIVLPCTGFTKETLESSDQKSAALVTKVGRKRERGRDRMCVCVCVCYVLSMGIMVTCFCCSCFEYGWACQHWERGALGLMYTERDDGCNFSALLVTTELHMP